MISDKSKSVLELIMRSPDRGNGVRTVSATCMSLLTDLPEQELIELSIDDDGSGTVKLTEKGEIAVMYAI